MRMLKRLISHTSSRILATLGGQRGSHELALASPVYQPASSPSCFTSPQAAKRFQAPARAKPSAGRRSREASKRQRRKHKHEQLNFEAELLASISRMPPLKFHPVHGPNALLSSANFAARRSQSFCQAIVFSDRVILPNERVYVKVTEITRGWSGTIRFGFTSLDPEHFRHDMPKHACPDMTSAGHTWARALPDETVKHNTVIHFSYNPAGFISYGINNHDCGVFPACFKPTTPLWFVVDIYGLTSAVELVDPRTHAPAWSAQLEQNYARSLEALGSLVRGHELAGLGAEQRARLVRLVKSNKQRAPLEPFALEAARSHAGSTFGLSVLGGRRAREPALPNLDSIVLQPSAQNIYTSMPAVNLCAPPNAAADYHSASLGDYHRIHAEAAASRPPARELVLEPLVMRASSQATSVLSPASNRHHHARPNRRSLDPTTNAPSDSFSDGRPVISQQFESLNLNDSDQSNYVHSQIKHTTKSWEHQAGQRDAANAPVAAARRARPTQQPNQTVSKRQPVDAPTTPANQVNQRTSSSKSKASSNSHFNGIQPKSASVSKASPKANAASPNDKSANNSMAKDCPICFERPINCVLYQCGHMCTCYECGVKQWRTQSRTCPICRTIIKDVIKTYMS